MVPQEHHHRTQSISYHLVWSLFLRQLIFLSVVNFFVFFLFLTGMVIWAEHWTDKAVNLMDTYGPPSAETLQWVGEGTFKIVPLYRDPEGLDCHDAFFATEDTADGLRNYSVPLEYTVEFENGDEPYAIVVDLTGVTTLFHLSFLTLLLVELIFLFVNIFGNNRSIHRTLKPLHELAATTARLNSVEYLSGLEMEALAGELAKINATHLDSRISLSATQTELKSLAHAINSMLDRVADAYSAQMRFVSDASHELRTPIAVIQGYSSMLDRWGKENPETLQESIDAIREEAKSMERLIEQLLFLARGDNKSQPLHKVPIDLSTLGAEVMREEGMLFPEHELLPVWDGDFVLTADPALLKQLLRILVDNSLKYTQAPGRVWLRLDQTEELVIITVEDEGMGIAPSAIPYIFQRFYRTDSSRTRQTGGTGLGLSIAQWIASQHQAWFEVQSREEIGTKITVCLPKN